MNDETPGQQLSCSPDPIAYVGRLSRISAQSLGAAAILVGYSHTGSQVAALTVTQRPSTTGLNKRLKVESHVCTVLNRSHTGLNKGLRVESKVFTVTQRLSTGLNKRLKVESHVCTALNRSHTGLIKDSEL